jgi:putative phosphoribosyl transferase
MLHTAKADLAAFLDIPPNASGIAVFAHGSGSSRFSSRNQFVARVLQEANLATLLLDLLTPAEEAEDARTGSLRFDIGLLAQRVEGAIDWCRASQATAALKVGLFGASTGAAAALVAAAHRPGVVDAVVSRGGRPDLAGDALGRVRAPTLLLVGARDEQVLALNRAAAAALVAADRELVVVPGAGHLFEEPGALARVAELARDWLTRYLGAHRQRRGG